MDVDPEPIADRRDARHGGGGEHTVDLDANLLKATSDARDAASSPRRADARLANQNKVSRLWSPLISSANVIN